MNRKYRNEKVRRREARRARVRKGMRESDRVRVTVFRSARHIYASLIDPVTGRTLGTVSTRSKGLTGEAGTRGIEAAKRVGAALAELAREKQVGPVVFDRNGFLFHGRVKAVADAAREAGLQL